MNTFAAFRYRNYRLWFSGQLISLTGTWMQATAQGYLVYTLTGSAETLGYLGFLSGAPAWLLMIYSGLVADRVPRRLLLMITQSAKMLLAFILGGLVIRQWVQPWHILALALLLGVANAFDTPPRKSLAADLVDRADLTNAMTLNDTMYNFCLRGRSAAVCDPDLAVPPGSSAGRVKTGRFSSSPPRSIDATISQGI